MPDLKAAEFNIISKQSLEKNSAQHADSFTTVSEITNLECEAFLGKNVDVVTPNGFEDSFVPTADKFNQARIEARKKLIEVASALTDSKINDDVLLIANSGRYEFRNKGIDLFIDSLGKINNSGHLNKEVVAFILIPANHYGPSPRFSQ